MTNKIFIISVVIILVIASFFIGYSINKTDSTYVEIQNLQTQVDTLQQQNNQLQNRLDNFQAENCPETLMNQSEKTCFELEPWNDAVGIIYSGQVESLYTSNSGLLSLRLKNDSWVRDVQMPTYVSIQDIISRCGNKCKDIAIATE